jgi:hypothetical protein
MGKISEMQDLRKMKRFGSPDTTPSRLRKKKKHVGGVSFVQRKALGVFVVEMNTKGLALSIFQIPSSLLLFCNRNLPLRVFSQLQLSRSLRVRYVWYANRV